MNQTELSKYRAVLEAKQTELSAGARPLRTGRPPTLVPVTRTRVTDSREVAGTFVLSRRGAWGLAEGKPR